MRKTTTPKSFPPFQDDSVLEGDASRVMAEINQFFSRDRLERAAMADERERLARELHDGLLQSLAGALLQLEALSNLIDENPQSARKRLRDIGDLIAEEQRELRYWLTNAKPTGATITCADLAAALEIQCQRAEKQWGLRVTLTTGGGMISRSLGDEVYRLVQEAIANVGRHASARSVSVTLQITTDQVRIDVADDGVGFPFQGRYDLEMLRDRRLGPRSLVARVASLGGDLVLTSDLSGSRLEMSLPLHLRPAYSTSGAAGR